MCTCVSVVCLHVHRHVEVDRSECSHTFACVLNYGMGYFSEEHRMQLAAETECLSCPEHGHTAGNANGCCSWQNTQSPPDMSVLMNVF